jgi:catechol 2,3-dioxygenase-like lactoylglutathione lyase family enzyme
MATTPPKIRFDHVNISVADLEVQRAWYETALGFAKVVERVELDDPPVRTVVLEAPGGMRIELIERAGSVRSRDDADPLEATGEQGYGHWAVDVEDLDIAFAQLAAAGAQTVWPPADAATAGARFAYVKDPEGNLLELIQPAAGS